MNERTKERMQEGRNERQKPILVDYVLKGRELRRRCSHILLARELSTCWHSTVDNPTLNRRGYNSVSRAQGNQSLHFWRTSPSQTLGLSLNRVDTDGPQNQRNLTVDWLQAQIDWLINWSAKSTTTGIKIISLVGYDVTHLWNLWREISLDTESCEVPTIWCFSVCTWNNSTDNLIPWNSFWFVLSSSVSLLVSVCVYVCFLLWEVVAAVGYSRWCST